ncbi:hypothetical protein PAXRUDRAFT_18562 [Paxillus rubicundulus Ve08.2h10]|uniref:Uncharacterized protein n=1 Tax=Paxillus rubicundulus Ve08.2h10 TaxID=930991 RepID=A0A0D0BXN3_9AGAM|nr:hypothetical protein PAXRUDRAFT_18562 [Paxillus rubicundulus Ve08.2h10]
MSSFQDQIIECYYQSTPFQQLVMYPTLAPHLVPDHVKENQPPQTPISQPSAPRPLGSVASQERNFGSIVTNERAPHPLGSPVQLSEASAPLSSTATPLASQGEANDASVIMKICREFLVSVSVSVLQAVTSKAPGRHGRAKIQKVTTVKQLRLPLEGMSRKNFLVEALDAHKLTEDYKPEFPFKLWWTGSPGGQKGAATVSTELEFSAPLQSIVKKSGNCNVMITFDLDEMSAFRKTKRVRVFINYWVVLTTFAKPIALTEFPDRSVPFDGYEEFEDVAASKVPRLDNYSDSARLNGHYILRLKGQWKCQEHTGEHGEPGFCYIKPDGGHFGLNTRRLGAWGATWAAQKASLLVPPNCNEFEGVHGGLVTPRPRGRTGPVPRQPSPAATSSPAIDMNLINSLLAAAILPMVSQLSQSQLHLPKPPSFLPPSLASTPESPLVLNDLVAMLEAFHAETSIDIVGRAQDLAHLDFTSDIISKLPLDRLAAAVTLHEGSAFRLQEFAQAWVARKNEKSRIEF